MSERAFPNDGRTGMTLREWYIGQALAGIVAGNEWNFDHNAAAPRIAEYAIEIADKIMEMKEKVNDEH